MSCSRRPFKQGPLPPPLPPHPRPAHPRALFPQARASSSRRLRGTWTRCMRAKLLSQAGRADHCAEGRPDKGASTLRDGHSFASASTFVQEAELHRCSTMPARHPYLPCCVAFNTSLLLRTGARNSCAAGTSRLESVRGRADAGSRSGRSWLRTLRSLLPLCSSCLTSLSPTHVVGCGHDELGMGALRGSSESGGRAERFLTPLPRRHRHLDSPSLGTHAPEQPRLVAEPRSGIKRLPTHALALALANRRLVDPPPDLSAPHGPPLPLAHAPPLRGGVHRPRRQRPARRGRARRDAEETEEGGEGVGEGVGEEGGGEGAARGPRRGWDGRGERGLGRGDGGRRGRGRAGGPRRAQAGGAAPLVAAARTRTPRRSARAARPVDAGGQHRGQQWDRRVEQRGRGGRRAERVERASRGGRRTGEGVTRWRRRCVHRLESFGSGALLRWGSDRRPQVGGSTSEARSLSLFSPRAATLA